MDIKKTTIPFLLAAVLANICSASIQIRNIYLLDSANAQRKLFSSSENAGFSVDINNTETVPRIYFSYRVSDPSGKEVFSNTGISIPGNTGTGGASLGNVPIKLFYTGFGYYTLTVRAESDTANYTEGNVQFRVYSPQITLSYPVDGSRDITDKPVIFRWTSTGATKYRIYVDDNMGFANPLLKDESFDTSYSYPAEPREDRQKLTGGRTYYWKAEGLDEFGNIVAQPPIAFSFTVKSEVSADKSVNLKLSGLRLKESMMSEDRIVVSVNLTNTGSGALTDIKVNLYLNGMSYGETALINYAGSGETKEADFEITPGDLTSDFMLVSASLDFSDDNPQDNLVTARIPLPDEYVKASVSGLLTGYDSAAGQDSPSVIFEGPVQGETFADEKGNYVIKNLVPGIYLIHIKCGGYEDTQVKQIILSKGQNEKDFNFYMKKKKRAAAALSLSEVWDVLLNYLQGTAAAKGLKGYYPSGVEDISLEELDSLLSELRAGKAKITGAEVRTIK